ncbi:MAG: LCP family protein [Chloroflexota bacterium]
MSRFEKISLVTLIFIAIGLWTDIGLNFLSAHWHNPLGPVLSMPSQIPTRQSNQPKINITNSLSLTQDLIFSPDNKYLSVRGTDQPALFNGPKSMTVLTIGSDTRAQTYLYGLADVIRYIRIDFVNPRISILEFPRDLWVTIPGIETHYGITHGKLNQAYFYGNPGMGYYDGTGQGPGLLASTLDLNFGAHPDHYIAANMQTFVHLVDSVGGIDIFLPFSVDARKPDQDKRKDLYFTAGQHHLSGEQALMLARIREYSVFARADQQNRILCALKKAVLSPYILPNLPSIINSFTNSVQTDLSPQQISEIACLLPQIKSENISFITFPRELLSEARTFDIGVQKDVYIFKADFETLKLYVKAFDLGAWPDQQSEVHSQATSTPRPRGEGLYKCP